MNFDPTVPSPVTTAVRDALKVIGTIIATTGFISDSSFQMIAGFVMAAVPIGYAIWKQIVMRYARTGA
jgi:hypothetical protein